MRTYGQDVRCSSGQNASETTSRGGPRHSFHNPLHCILPPYILDHMAGHPDEQIRRIAINAIALSEGLRSRRITVGLMPFMGEIPSPQGRKHRLVYDMHHATDPLPGALVRSEGQPPFGDAAADEAYDFSGYTYDFYKEIYNRNALDDKEMSMSSSVH